jgi:hypothetical protein
MWSSFFTQALRKKTGPTEIFGLQQGDHRLVADSFVYIFKYNYKSTTITEEEIWASNRLSARQQTATVLQPRQHSSKVLPITIVSHQQECTAAQRGAFSLFDRKRGNQEKSASGVSWGKKLWQTT